METMERREIVGDSMWQGAWRRLKRNRMAMGGLIFLIIIAFCAVAAPWVSPHDPYKTDFRFALEGPSRDHLLGRDNLGRDVLSRIIYGSRISISIGLISVAIGLAIGVPVGAFSGYYGGKFDLFIQRLVDIMMAFPGILLALIIVSVLGVGLTNAMIALGVVSIPQYIRLVRGSVLSLREEDFVQAARALGARDFIIIFRHILPNCLAPVIVQSTLQIATAILWAAGLGFLGLGAQAPLPEWGTMLSRGRTYLRVAHHVTTFPGLAIMLTVLGFNLLGDGLRDALDPRMKKMGV